MGHQHFPHHNMKGLKTCSAACLPTPIDRLTSSDFNHPPTIPRMSVVNHSLFIAFPQFWIRYPQSNPDSTHRYVHIRSPDHPSTRSHSMYSPYPGPRRWNLSCTFPKSSIVKWEKLFSYFHSNQGHGPFIVPSWCNLGVQWWMVNQLFSVNTI